MPGTGQITRLSLRKAELLAESDAIRQGLRANWVTLRPAISWVDGTMAFIRQVKPLCLVAAPVLGILVARRPKAAWGLAGRLTTGWRLWRAAKAALKVVSENSADRG